MAGTTRLDSLLLTAAAKRRRFQFALGIDERHPNQTAMGLVNAGQPYAVVLPEPLGSPTGWFLHIGAQNVLVTCIESLAAPRAGIRLRLLETEGRDTQTTIAAFRPIRAARTSDFRGQPTGVLSVSDGRAEIDIRAHGWIQVEVDW
jgi:hypothetical protein